MSSQLKKKNKRRRKKKQAEEMGEGKHERIGNLNLFSEEITKNMIEKIICLAINASFSKKLEKDMRNFCYDSLKKDFDNIIELYHINHDIDEFDLDSLDIKGSIKTNKSDMDIKRYLYRNHKKVVDSRNNNAERSLIEIANIRKDDIAYMDVKNKKIEDCLNKSVIIENNKYIKKPKKIQYSIEINKNNFWGYIPPPTIIDIDRTSSNFNNYIQLEKKYEEIKKVEKTPRKKERKKTKEDDKKKIKLLKKKSIFGFASFKISPLPKPIVENNLDYIPNKKGRVQMIEMPSFPLENFVTRKETDEILKLRKENIELMIERERELKKEQIRKLKIRKEEEEKEKMLKKGKYTYDNEGKLMMINEIKQENLHQEFWKVNSKQKEIKPAKDKEIYKKERIKMENNARKNIIYNDENESIFNSFLLKSRTLSVVNLNEIKKSSKKESLIKLRKRFDNFFPEYPAVNKAKEISGSNFNLINPSVGVKIKEKSQEKSGGNDFYKEFKKYSLEEFNKTLQDNIEWAKYKENEDKEKLNDGFKTTTLNNNGFNKFKKNIFLNNQEKKDNINESNNIINKEVKYNYLNRLKRNINHKNKLENFKKTFSEGFNKKQYKKNLINSSSEIIIENEKFIHLKDILFHEDSNQNNNFIRISPFNNNNIKVNNISLFRQYKNQSFQMKDNKTPNANKKFFDMDNFNKNIITGKAVSNQHIMYNKIVLPRLSMRNMEVNFNKSMLNFNRERTKKVIEGFMHISNSMNVERVKNAKSIKFL